MSDGTKITMTNMSKTTKTSEVKKDDATAAEVEETETEVEETEVEETETEEEAEAGKKDSEKSIDFDKEIEEENKRGKPDPAAAGNAFKKRQAKRKDGGAADTEEEGEEESPQYTSQSPFYLRENVDDADSTYTIAKCCNPIPGEDVIGFRGIHNSIVIHKSKCPTAVKLLSSQSDRVVPTRWTTHKVQSFLIKLGFQGIDRFGMFNNIATVISKELSINIRTVNLSSHDGIFEGEMELYVHSINDLTKLITNLGKIKGMEKVTRIESAEE